MRKSILYFYMITCPITVLFPANERGQPDRIPAPKQYCFPSEITHSVASHVCTDSIRFKEISGAIYWANFLWAITDDSKGEIFKINPVNGHLDNSIIVSTSDEYKFDWEDIAQDDLYIYIAGTGDNSYKSKNRYTKKILRIRKAELSAGRVNPEILQFYYHERTGEQIDCEAIFVKNGFIHLITKKDTDTRHYCLPVYGFGSSKTIKAESIETINSVCNFYITGADYKDSSVVLIGYENALGRKCDDIKCGIFAFSINDDGKKLYPRKNYYLGSENHIGQVESICFSKNDSIIVINEYGNVDNCKLNNTIRKYLLPW